MLQEKHQQGNITSCISSHLRLCIWKVIMTKPLPVKNEKVLGKAEIKL